MKVRFVAGSLSFAGALLMSAACLVTIPDVVTGDPTSPVEASTPSDAGTDVATTDVAVGSCGDCLGGACDAGNCQPFDFVRTAGARYWGIALHAPYVFISDDRGNDNPSSAILRFAEDGGDRFDIGSSSTAPSGIAVDDGSVYVVTEQDGQVHALGLSGGSQSFLTSNDYARGCIALAPSGGVLYFTHNDLVRRQPFGVAPTDIVLGQGSARGIAAGSDAIYWTRDDGQVWTSALDGGAPSMLVSGQISPGCMALDGDDLYWTETNAGRVKKLSLSTKQETVIASGETKPISVAVDAKSIWWTADEAVRRLAK